jgi:hypothetical protein
MIELHYWQSLVLWNAGVSYARLQRNHGEQLQKGKQADKSGGIRAFVALHVREMESRRRAQLEGRRGEGIHDS